MEWTAHAERDGEAILEQTPRPGRLNRNIVGENFSEGNHP
jgi:hypothetical protein